MRIEMHKDAENFFGTIEQTVVPSTRHRGGDTPHPSPERLFLNLSVFCPSNFTGKKRNRKSHLWQFHGMVVNHDS